MDDRFVAFYLHRLFNGGIERVLFNLAGEFVARGMRVELVLNQTGWSPMSDALPAGVRVVDLQAKRFVDRPGRLAAYLKAARPAALLASQHFSGEIAVLARRLARAPTRIVVWEHTTLSAERRTHARWSPRRWALAPAARAAYPHADAIVAVSNGVKDDLVRTLGLPAASITTIYNPVLSPDVRARGSAPLDHPWFAPGQPPVVVGVGRLEPQKDFRTLIRAFARVRAAMPARLMILGVGSLRAALREEIARLGLQADAELVGFVANPFAYLARARAFALSSAYEGLPTVLIEALALGTPVVSTTCPSGPAEILAGGRYGWLVPPRDPAALAGALRHVLCGDSGGADSSAWLRQFTPPVAADRFCDLLGLSDGARPTRAPGSGPIVVPA